MSTTHHTLPSAPKLGVEVRADELSPGDVIVLRPWRVGPRRANGDRQIQYGRSDRDGHNQRLGYRLTVARVLAVAGRVRVEFEEADQKPNISSPHYKYEVERSE